MVHSESEAGFEDLPELAYAGNPTFLKADEARPGELTGDIDVGVVGVPYDGAVSRQPGARFGPRAIRAASSWYAYLAGYKGGLFNVDTKRTVDFDELTVRDCGDVPTVPNDIQRTRRQITAYVGAVARHVFPVVLGGDHYVTYPAFTGVAQTRDQRCGVIQLDAHTDTVVSSELYGQHFHGSPMARIDESEHGGYQNHAMVGIRAYESPIYTEFIEGRGPYISDAGVVRERGIDTCLAEAIEYATNGVESVYLTVDIDAVDPAFAPGTGTPEPGGFTSSDLLRAMDQLGQSEEVVAMDVMEVAPNLDPTESTQRLAANAIVRFLEAKFL